MNAKLGSRFLISLMAAANVFNRTKAGCLARMVLQTRKSSVRADRRMDEQWPPM
jgi:hypothetical protein